MANRQLMMAALAAIAGANALTGSARSASGALPMPKPRPVPDGTYGVPPEPERTPPAPKHSNAREIARRLRQQERLEAKRAKRKGTTR